MTTPKLYLKFGKEKQLVDGWYRKDHLILGSEDNQPLPGYLLVVEQQGRRTRQTVFETQAGNSSKKRISVQGYSWLWLLYKNGFGEYFTGNQLKTAIDLDKELA